MKSLSAIVTAAALVLSPSLTHADTLTVNPDGTGDYATIQAALTAANSGDVIEVACGTYLEYNLVMKQGVTLRSETGDPSCVTIDAQGQGRVLYSSYLNLREFRAEGLTIMGGSAAIGGGVYCFYGLLRFSDCVFVGNSATINGGAVAIDANYFNAADFFECTFSGNSAGNQGGGLAVQSNSMAVVRNSIVAFSTDGQGIYADGSSAVELECCDIFGNEGGDWVGPIAGQLGIDGNMSEDPKFCCPERGIFRIDFRSLCRFCPVGSARIGACGVGCRGNRCEPWGGPPEEDPGRLHVADSESSTRDRFALYAASPNPFNPSTEITHTIPAGEGPWRVRLSVYDATGRKVRVLVDAVQGAGTYRTVWDGKDHEGMEVASGVYFCRITWNGESETKQVVLLK